MPNIKRENLVVTNTRLPRGLHRSLKLEAKRRGIPLNTLLTEKLEDYDARLVEQAADITQPLLDGAIERAIGAAAYTAAEVLLYAVREMAPSPSEPELARALTSMENLLREAEANKKFDAGYAGKPDEAGQGQDQYGEAWRTAARPGEAQSKDR